MGKAQELQKPQRRSLLQAQVVDVERYAPKDEATLADEVGLQMERSIEGLHDKMVPYVTRNAHGKKLRKRIPCYVRRSGAGHIIVLVSLPYTDPTQHDPSFYARLTFEGAWYLKGYENRERLNKIYKARKSKYFVGCRPF